MSNKTHYKKLAIFILSPILALAVLMFSATIATAGNVISFFINSSPVMVDSHAGMMLTSIEKERFGGSLEASLRCNTGFSIVSINDAPIEQENMRYTFENITAIYNHLLFDNTGYDVKLDTNFDGYITASDITEIYNVILGM